MFTEITPPGRTQAPSTGLIVSAGEISSTTDPPEAWTFGYRWRPTTCVGAVGTYDPCGDLSERPAAVDRSHVEAMPVGYYVEDECSIAPPGPDEQYVRDQVDAIASWVAARELWSGPITRAHPYTPADGGAAVSNHYLASGTAEQVGTGLNVRTAIGLLEQRARELRGGQVVMLHVPIAAVAALDGLRRVGNLLLTQSDGIVVPDAGYDGSGPDGAPATPAATWAYATGPVEVRLGPLSSTDLRAGLDRRTNRRVVRVDRLLAVAWDPCVHLAASMTLP